MISNYFMLCVVLVMFNFVVHNELHIFSGSVCVFKREGTIRHTYVAAFSIIACVVYIRPKYSFCN